MTYAEEQRLNRLDDYNGSIHYMLNSFACEEFSPLKRAFLDTTDEDYSTAELTVLFENGRDLKSHGKALARALREIADEIES